MCRLNPKVDFAFKKLFGSEENKDILIAFINSIVDKNEQIKDIKLKNSYNIADYRRGKMTVLDIKAAERNGRIEGIKEGEQQKEILIVKKLLLMGMDTDCMSEASGLYEKN